MTQQRLLAGAVAALAIVVVLVTWSVVTRVARDATDALAIHDPATLAEHISVCGRSWHRGDEIDPETSAAIRQRFGIDPVTVGTAFFAPCPAGVCTNVAKDVPCATVVWVRVGQDAFVAYELQGGP